MDDVLSARVTRLGEFSPIWLILANWANFRLCTYVNIGTIFANWTIAYFGSF
jgi:hypothetical protein